MNKNRNIIHIISSFVLLLICTHTSHCQTATLEGRITNEKGEGMEYVSVRLIGTVRPIGDISNSKGYYSFEIPSDKELIVLFTFTGYEQQKFTFKVKNNERKILNCTLKPQAQLLEEITIKDEKVRKSTFTQISIEKIENIAGPQSGVESLIKTLPDVGSNNELSSQYSVRGGSFDENLVYINDVEVYRPFLVRSGQQEGLSIINPDMVERVMFSPGGFEAKYGDKMSSVLDITYRRPNKFSGKVSGSLLGGSAYVEGVVKEKMTYSIGLRRHSNQYLLKSLDTEGDYTTAYTDLQSIITYKVNTKLDISFVGIYSKNKYGLVPKNQTTNFGNFFEAMELKIYFDGQEIDEYTTAMGAITLDYRPNDNMQWKWITSAYTTNESEVYDIQGQYWLYELNVGAVVGEVNKFDRGVGTYLEHARNYLNTRVINSEIKGTYFATLGNWNWGIRYQHEYICDKMKEWRMVDSADFTIPNPDNGIPGDSNNITFAPELQNYVKSQNTISSHRATGYLQRNFDFHTEKSLISIIFGVRGQYWSFNKEFFISPRLSVNYKPEWEKDMLFRISTGMYTQSPFYREYRYKNGSINKSIKSQKSYQIMGTFDYNFVLWNKPFKLTSDIYYKYITNLIPYEIDNMRIRYMAENNAIGYSTGISLRINGEFIDGIESWASLSLMRTQEDIEGDDYGWISRPTDQRMMIKLFFQDYMPTLPWMKVSLNFVYGTGLPFTKPRQTDFSTTHRLPPYFRVDITGGIQLNKIDKIKNRTLFRYFDDIWLNLEVFNLFNYKNVVSYIWVADYDNRYYAVPNFLTMRQFNIKLTITF